MPTLEAARSVPVGGGAPTTGGAALAPDLPGGPASRAEISVRAPRITRGVLPAWPFTSLFTLYPRWGAQGVGMMLVYHLPDAVHLVIALTCGGLLPRPEPWAAQPLRGLSHGDARHLVRPGQEAAG